MTDESETWEKLPPVENPGHRSNCQTCGPQPELLPMDALVLVGFGAAGVSRDGSHVWDENEMGGDFPETEEQEAQCRVQRFEDMAAADPEHDWRIYYYGPMSEAEYQRQGPEQWVLVKKGMGFA